MKETDRIIGPCPDGGFLHSLLSDAQAQPLDQQMQQIRACRLCEQDLPLGPRPVLRASTEARILVASQAPGTAAHASGIPFDDPSGTRLRHWMGIDHELFYDQQQIAIVPMGFCYPGRGRWGDLPPLPRCAATWRAPLLSQLSNLKLTLAIGQHAVGWHLPAARGSLADIVRAHAKPGATVLALPHPSPRNNIWLGRNPWFEREVVPLLRLAVARILS
jgi:uracil-DNA glycosylase